MQPKISPESPKGTPTSVSGESHTDMRPPRGTALTICLVLKRHSLVCYLTRSHVIAAYRNLRPAGRRMVREWEDQQTWKAAGIEVFRGESALRGDWSFWILEILL